MLELNRRIQSQIPGPVSDYGRSMPQLEQIKYAIYKGQSLTCFLWENGLPHFGIRKLLTENAIGCAFDLEEGTLLKLSSADSFARHPDY